MCSLSRNQVGNQLEDLLVFLVYSLPSNLSKLQVDNLRGLQNCDHQSSHLDGQQRNLRDFHLVVRRNSHCEVPRRNLPRDQSMLPVSNRLNSRPVNQFVSPSTHRVCNRQSTRETSHQHNLLVNPLRNPYAAPYINRLRSLLGSLALNP